MVLIVHVLKYNIDNVTKIARHNVPISKMNYRTLA